MIPGFLRSGFRILVLKVLYFRGFMTGFKIAEEIALPMAGVTDQLLASLKQEKYH